jgi:hypothetical protein
LETGLDGLYFTLVERTSEQEIVSNIHPFSPKINHRFARKLLHGNRRGKLGMWGLFAGGARK